MAHGVCLAGFEGCCMKCFRILLVLVAVFFSGGVFAMDKPKVMVMLAPGFEEG